jgi:hypothetical protein
MLTMGNTFKENYAEFNKTLGMIDRYFTLINHTKYFQIKDFLSEFIRLDGINFLCVCFTYLLQMDNDHYGDSQLIERIIKCVINILEFVIMIIEQVSLKNHLDQIESFFYYFSAFLEKLSLYYKINDDFFDCLMKYISSLDMNIELNNYENLRNKLLHLFLDRNFFKTNDYFTLVRIF